MTENKNQTLLIAGITPQFLDRGVLWFQKHEKKLKREIRLGSFTGRHLILLEKNQQINLYELLRQVSDLGYQKVQTISGPGEFSRIGDALKIFPINTKRVWQIELKGREIESLEPLSLDYLKNQSTTKSPPTKQNLKKTLKPGDFVVHLDHGIGIFQNITKQLGREYFKISYAKNDKLFVPVELEDKLSPYVGFQVPTIYRLGGSLWDRTKKKVKEDTIEFAKELIELCAQRENSQGFACPKESWLDKELAGDFKFNETPDQQKAIRQVFTDMEKERIMDRIVCGDVGFGKTEVALRAAFKATVAGKQVALLSPTTILARQHFETFLARLKKFSVSVKILSRLQTKAQQKQIIKKLAEGQIDIVVGTHRLIQKDIVFKNLGLLIIDEEQRFGVAQKERLKKFKNNIDVLSLSATPIPRTLHLALSGLRDISQIKTAPPGRLPVKNFILPYNLKIIKRAINFELKRSGQIYFLHNRVATISAFKEALQKQFKKVRIARIHGRLPEWELVEIIEKFKNKKIDILVATTIIENGLDFPDVNTLIVSDASKLGLAQAYQLRGRVGRSQTQAFAYFLYPTKKLTDKATQRLEALRQLQALGSGYQLALKDLEIRGAGNILGRQQSGAINKIGLNLYYQMLSESLEKLRETNKKPA